jgi:hypothetical protein
MKLQRFRSALRRMKSLFKVAPSAQRVQADHLDLVSKMETLP